MRLFISSCLVIAVIACSRENPNGVLLSGDLFFGPFRIGSFYNVPDSIRIKVETAADTLDINDIKHPNHEFLTIYTRLKEEKLLFKPFVDLRLDSGSFVKLYLDSIDYDKIKIYKRQRLLDEGNKVVVYAYVRKISDGFYYCTKLESVNVVKGFTSIKRDKFKIEDYN